MAKKLKQMEPMFHENPFFHAHIVPHHVRDIKCDFFLCVYETTWIHVNSTLTSNCDMCQRDNGIITSPHIYAPTESRLTHAPRLQ